MKKDLLFFILIILISNSIFAQQKIMVSIADNDDNCSIYQYGLNGNMEKKIFDFNSQPFFKTGKILHLRPSLDGTSLYFVSDNAHVCVPSRRNIFKIPNNGSWVKQLTPGPNSGQILPNVPTGTVKGRITDNNGNPYSSAAVFMEGLPLQYSDANGYFTFNNVPEGYRWITGYRPGTLVFKSLPVLVTAGLTTEVTLVPYSDYKINFEHPLEYGNSIYFIENSLEIYKSDLKAENKTKIFSTTGLSGIGGFDIAKQDGQILISDYNTGTPQQRGIYTCDKDGNNLSLFLDFKQDNNWDDVSEVFWSPDKTKIAVKAGYNYLVYFLILDAATGNILSSVYFNDNYTKYNVSLYGWDADGKWLLYSTWLNDTKNSNLAKIAVDNDGKMDPNNNVNLLENINLFGACWADVSKPNNISVIDKSKLQDIEIYPNPAKDFIKIKFDSKEKTKIYIYNETGSLIDAISPIDFHNGQNIINYDCSNLSTGRYIISIISNNKIIGNNSFEKT